MRSRQLPIYALVVALTAGTIALLLARDGILPPFGLSKFWNGVAAFVLTAVISEAWFLRAGFANVSASVAFVPLLASVLLFDHPVPMLIAGLTLATVETFVRRKPPIRVWFNTAQYMVAVGAGSLLYAALGGRTSLDSFSFSLLPFMTLVATFFVVNSASVALAVAASQGVSLKESWDRIGGNVKSYDILASSLSLLLAYLYANLQMLGLAIIMVPLLLVRQLYQVNLQLQEELEEKLELMVKSIEARDPYTSGHSRRVCEYAVAIARELGLHASELDTVKRAALLHDVGKIYEEFAPLLRKEGKLTPEEKMTMRTHVIRSAQLVATASRLRGTVEAMIKHHHENFDGSGYPDGLAAQQIPIGARIIMIADTLDAMTTDRPYRSALTLARAIEELERHASQQFDPELVKLVTKSTAIRRLFAAEPRPEVPLSFRKPQGTWVQRVAK